MNERLLLTVEYTVQAGNDLLILPGLHLDQYEFNGIERIKIVTSDNIVIEKDAEFAIPFDMSSREYWMLLPSTQKDDIPIGSQIWTYKSLNNK